MPQARIAIRDSRRHISQAQAVYLITIGFYRWALGEVGKMVERVPTPEALREKPLVLIPTGPYIPAALPPAEVSGCTFDGPIPEHQALHLARARALAGGKPRKRLAESMQFVSYIEAGRKRPVAREVLGTQELPATPSPVPEQASSL